MIPPLEKTITGKNLLLYLFIFLINKKNRQVVIDNELCRLEILDTAGQEEFLALREQWIRESDAFLIVYSITSRSSFDNLNSFFDQVERVKDSDYVPIILVGNKVDLENKREVSKEEAQIFAVERQVQYFETSAKTRINVEEAFFQIVRLARSGKLIKTKKFYFIGRGIENF
jgi:GTPase KRas